MPPSPVAIGHDRFIEWLTHGWDDVVGVIETHPARIDTPCCHAGDACEGSVLFRVSAQVDGSGRPLWDVDHWDPLTLAPSIVCRACGNHGFIRNGLWVPA